MAVNTLWLVVLSVVCTLVGVSCGVWLTIVWDNLFQRKQRQQRKKHRIEQRAEIERRLRDFFDYGTPMYISNNVYMELSYKTVDCLSRHLYRFVSFRQDKGTVGAFLYGETPVGIVQNKPKVGQAARVRHFGKSKIFCDSAVENGVLVEVGPNGGVVVLDEGHLVGLALEGGEKGAMITILLNPQPSFVQRSSISRPIAKRLISLDG